MLDKDLIDVTSGDDSSSSPSMRLNGGSSGASSVAVASRLYASQRRDGSRRGSFGSSDPDNELISFSDSEQQNDINFLSTQVSSLTKKLTEMEDSRVASMDDRNRLKMENAVLHERVHMLEEQVANTEQRYIEKLEEEKARHKDILVRCEREKQLELESAILKYQVLERDLTQQKSECQRLTSQVEKIQKESDQLREDLAESEMLKNEALEQRAKIEREFRRFKEAAQQDMDSSSELVEELHRQTHELRSSFPRQGSVADQLTFAEEELERVRIECRELKKTNEELQAQLLHDSLVKGRSLLEEGTSLAAELNPKDSSELLDALREQEVCNQKLRSYINGILMRVIELHPEILEINAPSEGS